MYVNFKFRKFKLIISYKLAVYLWLASKIYRGIARALSSRLGLQSLADNRAKCGRKNACVSAKMFLRRTVGK